MSSVRATAPIILTNRFKTLVYAALAVSQQP